MKGYGAVENLMYQWIHNWNGRQFTRLPDLFTSADCYWAMPDENVILRGGKAIYNYCKEAQEGERLLIHFPHTAFFDERDNGGVRGEWDTLSYEIDRENASSKYIWMHIKTDFILENGRWKILNLWIRQYFNMKKEKGALVRDIRVPDFSSEESYDAPDGILIQRILNRLNQSVFQELDSYISETADVTIQLPKVFSKMLKTKDEVKKSVAELREKIQRRDELPITFFFAPVLCKDCNGVKIYCYVYDSQIKYDSPMKAHLHIGVSYGCVKLITENGSWKISHILTEEIGVIRNIEFEPETRYQRFFDGLQTDSWEPVIAASGNNGCTEDIYEIASIFAHWIIDMKGNPCAGFVDEYIINSKEECRFSLQANGPLLGQTWVGDAKIREMASKMSAEDDLEYVAGGHMAALPVIEVNPEGTYAQARFMDYNCALKSVVMTKTATGITLEKQELDAEKLPYLDDYNDTLRFIDKTSEEDVYLAGLCRYLHKFVKENGKWKLYDFCWTPLIVFPDYVYSKRDAIGWGTDRPRKAFPMLGTEIDT